MELDINEKVMLYAMQSLGYYAEIADGTEKRTDSYTNRNCPVLLTNASEKEFLTLWDFNLGEDDDDDYFNKWTEKFDPVHIEYIYDRCINEGGYDGWESPMYVYQACLPLEDRIDGNPYVYGPNVIECGFHDHSHIVANTNQPPRYNSNEVICFYSHSQGKYQPFSNFFLSEMKIEYYRGDPPQISRVEKYPSIEHYFQIMKALEFDPEGEILTKMRGDVSCKEIKALGRKVQNFDADMWRIRSRIHMRDALAMKFWQNDELRDLLLSTGDAILAEAAPRDALWGIGYGENNPKAQNPAEWRGKNVLGNMLMYLRGWIREAQEKDDDLN